MNDTLKILGFSRLVESPAFYQVATVLLVQCIELDTVKV